MSIVKKEAYFMSTTGEHKIRCLIWQDEDILPIGIFQIAHGVAEHIERYDEFARFIAESGFIVCGNDHLGHGKSTGSIEDLNIMPKDGNIRLIDDMHKLYNIMSKRYPGLPYIMFGHSMGSFCARVYAALFGEDLAGAIFCGTGEVPSLLSLIEKPLDYIVDIIGADKKSDTLTKWFSKISNMGIKNAQTSCDWLSFNEENVKNYISDPLCGASFTPGEFKVIFSLMADACSSDWAYKVPEGLPLLLVSGAKDPVGLFGVGVKATYDNLEEAGRNPAIMIFPEARHEILNEAPYIREQAYMYILQWCFMAISQGLDNYMDCETPCFDFASEEE